MLHLKCFLASRTMKMSEAFQCAVRLLSSTSLLSVSIEGGPALTSAFSCFEAVDKFLARISADDATSEVSVSEALRTISGWGAFNAAFQAKTLSHGPCLQYKRFDQASTCSNLGPFINSSYSCWLLISHVREEDNLKTHQPNTNPRLTE
jgi:hypothetical protein